MPTVACPHCQVANEAPAGNAPFFCKACHAIVDRTGGLRQAPTSLPATSGAPPRAAGRGTLPPLPGGAGDRAGSINFSVPTGPGAGFSVGGSRVVGFLLAALAAALVGGLLAWLGAFVLRVPILFPFLAGWAIRRALATGSGGGTPDRGVLGGIFLAALALGTVVAARHAEYLASAERESVHFREVYGPPATAMRDPQSVVAALRAADPDGDGKIATSGGRSFGVSEEILHVQTARATGVAPSDAYDIFLLATTGYGGFVGHTHHVVHEGDQLRLVASSNGFHLPGFALVVLWLVEAIVVLVTAFGRID
jgi:hypothetical protein